MHSLVYSVQDGTGNGCFFFFSQINWFVKAASLSHAWLQFNCSRKQPWWKAMDITFSFRVSATKWCPPTTQLVFNKIKKKKKKTQNLKYQHLLFGSAHIYKVSFYFHCYLKGFNCFFFYNFPVFAHIKQENAHHQRVAADKQIIATRSTNHLWPESRYQKTHKYFLTVNLTVETF